MKTNIPMLIVALLMTLQLHAQIEPHAANWKTWFIPSGKAFRLPPPPSSRDELKDVIEMQRNPDSAMAQHIIYWNAGSPGYRWHDLMSKLWKSDTSRYGVLANLVLGVATYDAIIAAWDTKYAYNRPRPFLVDNRVKLYIPDPRTPSYPCEHSVAAGVAATVISYFYPAKAREVKEKVEQMMLARIASGASFPSDTRAGYDLGKRIAEKEIEHTKDFVSPERWDGKIPSGSRVWTGKRPMFPVAGRNKTVLLDSSSQFRPGPPPDFAEEMDELRNFKPTFRSMANAFHYATDGEDVLSKKIFEHNLHLNPPRAERIYAITAIATYDGFAACWDAKYTYWGIRPDQFDSTYRPLLIHTPPFPGYPSGHAMVGGVLSELFTYFFPGDAAYFHKRAEDGAESRFHGGIHFRSDNEIGLDMGRKVGAYIVQQIKADGVDSAVKLSDQRGSGPGTERYGKN